MKTMTWKEYLELLKENATTKEELDRLNKMLKESE